MQIETIEITGFPTMLKGLRLPFKLICRSELSRINSFKLYKKDKLTIQCNVAIPEYTRILLADKDLKLLQSLIKKGDEHAKVVRFIKASCELTATRFFWSEMDTYTQGRVSISESTMHTIINEELTIDNFEVEDEDDKEQVLKYIALVL